MRYETKSGRRFVLATYTAEEWAVEVAEVLERLGVSAEYRDRMVREIKEATQL